MFGELAHRLPSVLRMGDSLVVPTKLNPSAIYSMTSIGSVATGQTGATTLVGSGVGSLTLPPNLLKPGTTIVIEGEGYYTSTTTGTATLVSTLSLGGVAIATLNGAAGVQMPGSLTDAGTRLKCRVTCRATGLATTVIALGYWEFDEATTVPGPIATTASFNAIIPFKSGNAGAVPAAVTTVPSANRALAISLAVTTGATLAINFVTFNVYQIY